MFLIFSILHNINYSSKTHKVFINKSITKLLTILFLSILVNNYSQNLAYNFESISKNYIQAETLKIDSITQEFKNYKKTKFLSILPSVNYNPIQNDFNIGISASNLTNYFLIKERNQTELKKLRFELENQLKNETLKLKDEFDLINDTFDLLKIEIENKKLENDIYKLKKMQYENNKITLETWLNVQKEYQNKTLMLKAKVKNLMRKINQFIQKIKSPCYEQELNFLASNL